MIQESDLDHRLTYVSADPRFGQHPSNSWRSLDGRRKLSDDETWAFRREFYRRQDVQMSRNRVSKMPTRKLPEK